MRVKYRYNKLNMYRRPTFSHISMPIGYPTFFLSSVLGKEVCTIYKTLAATIIFTISFADATGLSILSNSKQSLYQLLVGCSGEAL